MAFVLDLNDISCSMMDLTLRDKERTVVHLDIPSEELVQEMEAMQGDLDSIKKGDFAAVKKIYEVAAKVINVNLDFFEVTAQELPSKYGMNVLATLQFLSKYMDALDAIAKEKN